VVTERRVSIASTESILSMVSGTSREQPRRRLASLSLLPAAPVRYAVEQGHAFRRFAAVLRGARAAGARLVGVVEACRTAGVGGKGRIRACCGGTFACANVWSTQAGEKLLLEASGGGHMVF
jgi:hypothetical protein